VIRTSGLVMHMDVGRVIFPFGRPPPGVIHVLPRHHSAPCLINPRRGISRSTFRDIPIDVPFTTSSRHKAE
jgi:hypothetical protein